MENLVNRLLSIKNIAIFTVVIFFLNGVYFSAQPLIDLHGFRQTQTASSAFWIAKDLSFFKLNYPLPTIGFPWSAPFEFPFFQSVVALVYIITGLNLDQIGRLLSVFFTLLIIYPLYKLSKRFSLSQDTLHLAIIFIFSSTQYVYWGRTFLIETFSVFLVLFTFHLFFSIKEKPTPSNLILFPLLCCLSLLTKVTTSFVPIFMLLVIESWQIASNALRKKVIGFKNIYMVLAILTSFLVYLSWLRYTDVIKSKGEISKYLSSENLSGWNFGDLDQRFSFDFWVNLILVKNLLQTPVAFLGLLVLISLLRKSFRFKNLVIALVILWITPMLIFANLHLVHIYYQTETLIFLLIAISISVGDLPTILKKKINFSFVGLAACILNLLVFFILFFPNQQSRLSGELDLKVASAVQNQVRDSDILVGIGKDWDSTIPYYAKRFSVMIPDWLPNKYQFLERNSFDPDYQRQVGALLICPNSFSNQDLSAEQIELLRTKWKLFKSESIGDCSLYSNHAER